MDANLLYIRRKIKIFTDNYSANIGFNPRIFLLERLLHLLDGVFLGGFCNVDLRLHGFVIGMAGEFHHNLGRDANGEHETDEGLAAAMGADFAVFGDGDVVASAFRSSSSTLRHTCSIGKR